MISIKNLNFSFENALQSTQIIKNLSFEVNAGEFLAIQGPSGSGKSTMLYLLGGLLRFQQGDITIFGTQLQKLTDDELCLFRNRHIGFVFQQFHLLPKTSVLNNLLLPTMYPLEKPKRPTEEYHARARELAAEFDLTTRLEHLSNELSGGQQQRVAIARALMNNASFILADEPTGNLDTTNSMRVMESLRELNAQGKTIIVITHDRDIAVFADRIIHLRDGELESEEILRKTSNHSTWTTPNIAFKKVHFGQVIAHSLTLAVNNLRRQWSRSILTAIGIVIGIAAVLSMITLGNFTQEKVLASYAELGVNTLNFSGWPNWQLQAKDETPLPFKSFDWEKDLLPIYRIFPGVEKMTPMMSNFTISAVSFGGKKIDTNIRGIGMNEHGSAIQRRKIKSGRSISAYDVQNRNAVCMIGSDIATRLYPKGEAVGKNLHLSNSQGNVSCHVIAEFEPLASNEDQRKANREIYVPFTFVPTLSEHSWGTMIFDVLMALKPGQDIEKTGKGIENFFWSKYGKSGEFHVDSDSILIAQMNRFLYLFTILLAAVAFLSLTIGSIGIMNMMLVSVAERLREIGLRKAMGATNRSIRWQFLMESVVLCVCAGLCGMILGMMVYEGVILTATKFVKNLEFEWRFDSLALAVSTCSIVVVGIISGIVPALQAERLQVIAALRSE